MLPGSSFLGKITLEGASGNHGKRREHECRGGHCADDPGQDQEGCFALVAYDLEADFGPVVGAGGGDYGYEVLHAED